MHAVVFHAHGDVDALALAELPRPSADPCSVVVRVRAVAVNHLDLWVRRGWPGLKLELPHLLGTDVAGEIAEVGPGVSGARVGDAVVVQPGRSCGRCEDCVAGRDNLCPRYHLIGEHVTGGYAEYLRVPADALAPKPAALSFAEAAAVPVTFMTAWHMLVARAAVRRDETVLVHAAGSGVGSAAVQIAKMQGARVIATAGSDDKLRQAAALGADHAINYSQGGFRDAVRDLTAGRGCEVIVEHVGAATWDDSLRSLARGGRLVTCGATTGHDVRVDLRHLFYKQQSLLGSTMGTRAELHEILRHCGAGRLRPVIDRTLPLTEARQAHLALQRREHFGKIVLLPT